MSDVEQICTHAAVMRDGPVIASGEIDELIAREGATSLETAYLGFVR